MNSPVGRGRVTNRLQVGDVGFLGNVRFAGSVEKVVFG
jgi:hypothetical protein